MSQFYIFLLCAAAGAAGGVLYDCLSLLRAPAFLRKFRAVRWGTDALFCILFTVGFLALSAAFLFPPLRFYMCLGILAGFGLYSKSLHKILAFLAKKMYNIYKYPRKVQKACPKAKKAFRKKK